MGFVTTEFVAAALLDMEYHTLKETGTINVKTFEEQAMKQIGLIDEIIPRYRSTYSPISLAGLFRRVLRDFWAEVWTERSKRSRKTGFDQETARLFRENVLSKGNSDDPMELYKRSMVPSPIQFTY